MIDDGSTCNENRIGAGNDLILGLQEIDDDCLVMACDNLLDFSLSCFIDYFYIDKVSSIMCYKEKDEEKLKRTGQTVLCENKVMDFKEKPSISVSNFAVPPFYIFNKEDIKIIKGLKGSYDSLGSIIEEVVNKIHLKAYKMVGKRLDLGN